MQLRLAILCSDGPHHQFLVSRLAAHFSIGAVIVEPTAEQARRLLHRGLLRRWLWLKYHMMRRRLLSLDGYRRRFFAAAMEASKRTNRSGYQPRCELHGLTTRRWSPRCGRQDRTLRSSWARRS